MQSIQEPAFSVAENWLNAGNVHHRTVLRAIRDNRLPAFPRRRQGLEDQMGSGATVESGQNGS